jgi:hypothetical protein
MFRFYLQRYFSKVAAHSGLLILAVAPALIYLAFAAGRQDRFTVYQDVVIPQEAPLAVANSPTDFATVDWFLNNQSELFFDSFTLFVLNQQMQRELGASASLPSPRQLRDVLSLGYANTRMRVTYAGGDQSMGRFLVGFYGNRIVNKADEGFRRQEMMQAQQGQVDEEIATMERPYIGLSGAPVVESSRALWRNERLPMTLALLGLGILAVLIIIAFMDALDVSFRSERQIARSLHIPVLGAVPNVSRIARAMGGRI